MTPRRYIRASELARWTYCHRAWWLQYIQGHPPMNQEALQRGYRLHESHGKKVRHAEFYRFLALLLLGVALLVLILLVLILF